MSKIVDAKGRNIEKDGESGYTRVIGNSALGHLLSRVQATVISNGNELERIITDRCKSISDIDSFIDSVSARQINAGVFLCTKTALKQTKKYTMVKGIEPDMLIFIVSDFNICKVIELKDGDTFDTKKVKGEKDNLIKFVERFGSKIPFATDYYICCFNQDNKEIIKIGMKNEFELEHILTGRELCEILSIDYEEIIQKRKRDMQENFDYFISELLGIPEVRAEIEAKI
ncbi:restriction endonuclease [Campylobacter sp. 7477a]|uniref:restriction endonuclease n=1 Tax=Campylobacter sp. 7477a TaxID=2735741 RepID=UPI0030155D20|nr:restriction endonuclease [Campylobacter sp. 7477a]